VRTSAVTTRTTLLLARFRFHLNLPCRDGIRQLVAEDAQLLAFRGSPTAPDWLTDTDTAALLTAIPDANVPADQARHLTNRVLGQLPAVLPELQHRADLHAARLHDSHRRVRTGAGMARRGLKVTAQEPVDVLGVYLYLPLHGGVA
jgi:hypothetical protein